MIRTPPPQLPEELLEASPELRIAHSDYAWRFVDSDISRPILVPPTSIGGIPRAIVFHHRASIFMQVPGGEIHSQLGIALDHFDHRAYWCVVSFESRRHTAESLSQDAALLAWQNSLEDSRSLPPTS